MISVEGYDQTQLNRKEWVMVRGAGFGGGEDNILFVTIHLLHWSGKIVVNQAVKNKNFILKNTMLLSRTDALAVQIIQKIKKLHL